MRRGEGKEIIAYCSYCKDEIYNGQKYVVNEDGNMFHKECDDLINDNVDYFAR